MFVDLLLCNVQSSFDENNLFYPSFFVFMRERGLEQFLGRSRLDGGYFQSGLRGLRFIESTRSVTLNGSCY